MIARYYMIMEKGKSVNVETSNICRWSRFMSLEKVEAVLKYLLMKKLDLYLCCSPVPAPPPLSLAQPGILPHAHILPGPQTRSLPAGNEIYHRFVFFIQPS